MMIATQDVNSTGVVSWWMFLCLLATINISAWSLAARALEHRRVAMSIESYSAGRLQLILSAAYVFGCAFRSVLPVYDIPRLCLFDTWVSSVIVGRSVATFAELCFAGQWALMLAITARSTGSIAAKIASQVLLPLIATAEVCSWYAVLTKSNLGHVAENSIWGMAALLGLMATMTLVPRYAPARRRILIAWCTAGVLYVGFMFLFDVPTYWARWVADQAQGRHYLSIAQGLADAANHRVVSYRWDDWKSEVVWMSLYFSIAVWISISLVHARMPATRVQVQRTAATGPRNSRSAIVAK
jgi:hypothetical protein